MGHSLSVSIILDVVTELQKYAIEHPKARASGEPRHVWDPPWSIILTVNK